MDVKEKFQHLPLWFQKKFKRNREANLFLMIVFCVGIVMACINPPFYECDGGLHYEWAMDVSYGNVLSPLANLSGHNKDVVTVPENYSDIKYRLVKPDTGEGGEYIRYLKTVKFSSETREKERDWIFTSLFYYPQALGLFLGRLFHVSVYWGVVLSRIMNLFAFLALVYTAIVITPVFKNIMAVAAMFPLAVYQAASLSPDSMLNGCCFLFTALCFSYAYRERDHLGRKAALGLGVLLGIISLHKYVYACLGLLVFLIPRKKFGTRKDYWKCFAIACIPLVICAVLGMRNATDTISVGQSFGVVDGMTQTQFLMEHPRFIFKLLYRTLRYKFNDYMLWLNTLGSLDCMLGPMVHLVPGLAVFVASLDQNDVSANIRRRDKYLGLFVFLLISVGIVMGLYIGDGRANPVGSDVVQGVQGRYFIPVIPVFLAAICPKGYRSKISHFAEKAAGAMAVMLLYSTFILYRSCS